MKDRRVRFTATAQRHVNREHIWRLVNRDHHALFALELETALRTLALLPGAGSAYTLTKVVGLRRLYVPKLACHLYYTFDDEQVIVRAFWGARRKRGPKLG